MFYDRFLEACNRNNESPSRVALTIGASKSNVTNWKNGASPSADIIIRASIYLNVTADYLLGLSDYMTTDEERIMEPLSETKADQMALDVYRKLSDCMLSFKTFYSEKYALYENVSDGEKEPIVPMNRILCKYLNRLIENYEIIADDLINEKPSNTIIIDSTISEVSNLELLMEEILKICDQNAGILKLEDLV